MGRLLRSFVDCFKLQSYRLSSGMALPSDGPRSYEGALNALNDLQSNAAAIEKFKSSKTRERSLPEMLQFVERVGLKMEDVDGLNVIHVSGTKGKGSTCAFCESILRSHGFKTGFYSSPHIVEARERIRINGRPLTRESFAGYFWDCHAPLVRSKEMHDGEMPGYFRFLTIMAFHVFLQEKVDVVILEVGIGGQYDCTNVVLNPVVCGVTSLGIDHTNVLGRTIEEIAWNKAGIFKKGVPAITVPQKKEAMTVLEQRARELGAPLYLAPIADSCMSSLGIAGSMQSHNAGLAIQLSSFWLRDKSKGLKERVKENSVILSESQRLPLECGQARIDSRVLNGLTSCRWPGRCDKQVWDGISFYLDGAHTEESIKVCVDWYLNELRPELVGSTSCRVLWFNSTGDRNAETLLRGLMKCDFHWTIFTPNIQSQDATNASDLVDKKSTSDAQIKRCLANRREWLKLNDAADAKSNVLSDGRRKHLVGDPLDAEKSRDVADRRSLVFQSIEDGLEWLKEMKEYNRNDLKVLCTGSLHLVGGILSFLDPNICSK